MDTYPEGEMDDSAYVVANLRDGFTPQTTTPRGNLEGVNPEFYMLTSIDNGQMLDARTNETCAPRFGNTG